MAYISLYGTMFNKVSRIRAAAEWEKHKRAHTWRYSISTSSTTIIGRLFVYALRELNFRTWCTSAIDPVKLDLNFNGCYRKVRLFDVSRGLWAAAMHDSAPRRLIATKREIDSNSAMSYSSRHPNDLVWTTPDYVEPCRTTDVIVMWNRAAGFWG